MFAFKMYLNVFTLFCMDVSNAGEGARCSGGELFLRSGGHVKDLRGLLVPRRATHSCSTVVAGEVRNQLQQRHADESSTECNRLTTLSLSKFVCILATAIA